MNVKTENVKLKISLYLDCRKFYTLYLNFILFHLFIYLFCITPIFQLKFFQVWVSNLYGPISAPYEGALVHPLMLKEQFGSLKTKSQQEPPSSTLLFGKRHLWPLSFNL